MNLVIPLAVILLVLLIIFALLAVVPLRIPRLVKIGGDGQKTYLFSGNQGMDYTIFRSYLRQFGYIPLPDSEFIKDGELLRSSVSPGIDYVDLLFVETHIDTGYDHNTYTIKCAVQSIHNANSVVQICRKDRLHDLLNGKDIITKSTPLEKFTYSGGVYILRPASLLSAGGADILVIYDKKSFRAAKKFYEKKKEGQAKSKHKHTQYYSVIVSEYITNPLLWDGYKFHMRIHIITISGKPLKFFRGCAEMISAKSEYIANDWSNKDIHDTHFSTATKHGLYPKDFPDQLLIPSIEQQIDKIEKELSEVKFYPYENAKKSFQVLGADIMITNSGHVYLLEINGRPGFEFKSEENAKIFIELFNNWLWNEVSKLLT